MQVNEVEDLDKDDFPPGQPDPAETFRDDAQPHLDDDERSLAEMALAEKAKGARNPRPKAAAMKRPAAAGMAAGDEAESAAAETEAEAAATEKAEAPAAEAEHGGGGLPAKPTPAASVSGGKDTRRKGTQKKVEPQDESEDDEDEEEESDGDDYGEKVKLRAAASVAALKVKHKGQLGKVAKHMCDLQCHNSHQREKPSHRQSSHLGSHTHTHTHTPGIGLRWAALVVPPNLSQMGMSRCSKGPHAG